MAVKSFNLGKYEQYLLDSRTSENRSRSAVLRDVLDRYGVICTECTPQCNKAEWSLFVFALKDLRSPSMLSFVEKRIEHILQKDSHFQQWIDRKWIDVDTLLSRIQKEFHVANVIAIMDVVDRFWSAPEGVEISIPNHEFTLSAPGGFDFESRYIAIIERQLEQSGE